MHDNVDEAMNMNHKPFKIQMCEINNAFASYLDKVIDSWHTICLGTYLYYAGWQSTVRASWYLYKMAFNSEIFFI